MIEKLREWINSIHSAKEGKLGKILGKASEPIYSFWLQGVRLTHVTPCNELYELGEQGDDNERILFPGNY